MTSVNMQKTLDSFFGGKRSATESPEGEKAPKKQKVDNGVAVEKKAVSDDSGLDPIVAEYVGYLQDPGWKEALMPEFKKPYFKQLLHFIQGILLLDLIVIFFFFTVFFSSGKR